MKRFFATLLALVMCLSMVPTAFAITDDTVVAENTSVADEDGWVLLELPSSSEDGSVAVPYGGGTETWYETGTMGGKFVGSFTMEGNNLTPVKTIGDQLVNSALVIDTRFSCSTKPVILTVQIRQAYTGKVLAQSKSSGTYSGDVNTYVEFINKGEKVQIYFRVTDINGKYDDNLKCQISYYYFLYSQDLT